MKRQIWIFTLLFTAVSVGGCRESEHYPSAEQLQGLVINEVSGYQDKPEESWIECCNTGGRTIDLVGYDPHVVV